jgi:GGDEF domain-containing protein
MTTALYHIERTCITCRAMRNENARLAAELHAARWNPTLNMYNMSGGLAAIAALPPGTYAIVFCDIDRLKMINSATGNHLQTNRYLAAGLRVRRGEVAVQFLGDEFVFILGRARGVADPAAFVARLTRQLATQPLTASERAVLGGADLSATFAWRAGVPRTEILSAIEQLSKRVLAKKAARR